MFIDGLQVGAFYDAVIRPEFETGEVVLSDSVTRTTEIAGGLALGSAFPWVKASAEASAKRGKKHSTGNQITLKPVQTAQRQLEHLAFYYLDRYYDPPSSRIRMVTAVQGAEGVEFHNAPDVPPLWNDPKFILQVPRALVFMDLPENTRFIPTALETVKGEVKTLYDDLAARLTLQGEEAPEYPGSSPDSEEERKEYGSWFDDRFNDSAAMETVEGTVGADRIQWIDYRVAIGKGKTFLHLHVSGRGEYDTGTFAYRFIKRGSKHGLRLVGTLTSEPDMNVLAILEK